MTVIPESHAPRRATAELLRNIRDRRAKVGIIGLGYVGLPLARCFAAGGFSVLGFDVDRVKIDKLQRGESYIGHISPRIVAEMRGQGFEATDRFERLTEPDAILICVPTPLTDAREPDLQYRGSFGRRPSPRGCGPVNSSSSKVRPTPAPRATLCSPFSKQAD